ncbi:MAG: hypothetical protein LBV15_03465, partial [Planctomycetota bacterium]|nr:hypothetical protein [Planctomycetota bacterium]
MKVKSNKICCKWLLAVLALALLSGHGLAAQYVIKAASPSNPEDNFVKAMFHFKKIVEERSQGAIEVQVFHSAQLGAHRD